MRHRASARRHGYRWLARPGRLRACRGGEGARPHATVTADLFHVVQLAVKAVGDVRRRVARARYGRRGRSGNPEYGIKGLLVWNLT
jgi:hypothetical protein